MRRVIFMVVIGLGALLLFSGCNGIMPKQQAQKPKVIKQVIVQKVSKEQIAKVIRDEKLAQANNFMSEKQFVVYGEGIAPVNTISPAQALALAKRAAVTDAYRQLGEKLYGIKINAKETVKDAALKDSRIVTQVNGLIKNASITESKFKDGLFTVRMELDMNGNRWKEIFSY